MLKKIALAVVAVMAVLLLYPEQDVDESSPSNPAVVGLVEPSTPSSAAEDDPSQIEQFVMELDLDKLLDPDFVNDPALVLLAEHNDVTPACLVAGLKAQVHGIIDNEPCKVDQALRKAKFAEHRISVSEHPYDEFSDAELRSLAVSSAEAAYILAQRLKFDAEAERFYEQAVALSGKSGPLMIWLAHQGAGGITRTNGILNVEKAALNFEVSLVMKMLGWPDDTVANLAEEALVEEGVDLEALRQRADDRYNRITARRQELLGRDWDE